MDLLCRESADQPYKPVALTGDRLRVGRRFENDLVLSHASVSRHHAELVHEGGKWFVVDCDSKFGTSLNGERVVRADLSPGDEIRIGGDDGPTLIFRPEGPPPPPPPDPVTTGELAPIVAPPDAPPDLRRSPGDAMRLVEQFRATSLIGDYHEALTVVVDAALALTHFERAALVLVGPGDGTDGLRPEVLRSRGGSGALSSDVDRLAPLVRATVATGRMIVIAPEIVPSEAEREHAALARAAGIVRAVCVPLATISGGGNVSTTGESKRSIVGVLYIESGVGAPPVAESGRDALESLANEAGHVVDRMYARQFSIAHTRAAQEASATRAAARAKDEGLSLAARARAACELAHHMFTVGNIDGAAAALEMFEDATTRAELPDTPRAEVLKMLGITLMWQGRWHRAAGVLNAALDIATEAQNLVQEMAVRTHIARSYAEIGELGIAREHALSAVSVLRRADEFSADHARALLALGVIELIDRDLPSASHTFRAAARVAEQTDDLLARASAFYRLGMVLAERGDTAEAVNAFQRMLEIAHPLGNAMLLLVGQGALAACLVRSGAWRRAEAVVAAGLAITDDEERYADYLARLLLLDATIAVRRDGGGQAERAVAAVRAHASSQDMRAVLAEADLLDAELRTEAGDLDGVRVAVTSAAATAREVGDPGLLARAHLTLAEAERRERNFVAADREIARARALANDGHDLALAGATQLAVGRLHADRSRLTEAQHSLAQSLSIFRTVDDRRMIGAAHLDLGHLMLDANDPACARTHLQLAREIFAELGIGSALASAEAGLATALAQGGASAPVSYSSVILSAKSESRFVPRLLEATQSRGLLLRELTSIAIDVSNASSAVVVSCTADGRTEVMASSGDEAARVVPTIAVLRCVRGEVVRTSGLTLYPVERLSGDAPDASATALVIGSTVVTNSRADTTLQVVVQLGQQGLELVALRSSLKRADLPDAALLTTGEEGDAGGATAGLIYASASMRTLVERIQRIRTSASTVLITGESGVGKELVARAIHAARARTGAPFVPFNCTATPRDLIESHLFGHRRGAFTGATADHPGVARAAVNGSLFLDEVGDLPYEVQPKLLRFLESGEIQPLGQSTPLKIDVRVIAATNADLEGAVAERRFREDLYHRLNIIRLHIPPLRERAEDIPLLVSHFLTKSAERGGLGRMPTLSEEALEVLSAYAWPGNVRQLRNEVERVVTFSNEDSTVTRDHLSEEIVAAVARMSGSGRSADAKSLPLPDRLKLYEVEQISHALAESDANLTRAAGMLGMARQNLQRRIKKLGLKSPDS